MKKAIAQCAYFQSEVEAHARQCEMRELIESARAARELASDLEILWAALQAFV
jgi:hypothetical protein